MDDLVIKTENLSKTYGWWLWKKNTPALSNLNLEIPKGTIFGFLGPNGAGKTTTIRLLMDLIKPSSGSASVFGKPVDNVKVKHKIGFLPDSPSFSSYLSAYEFLNICAKLLKISGSQRKQRIYEVLEIVKMTEYAKAKLGGFSRGMIQRIGIAQALLNDPELLILDEPLVGLDPLGRQELKDIIFKQKEKGTNVFFCSHILSDVENICDHIGILYRGNLLCFGALKELLAPKGTKISVSSKASGLIGDLMTRASSTHKRDDGGWELEFVDGDAEVKKQLDDLKSAHPNDIQAGATHESLENFFFKTIDKHKTQL